jgi:hypothetical protein
MRQAQIARHSTKKFVVSEETKEKIRAKLKGKKLSEETKQKMREARNKEV